MKKKLFITFFTLSFLGSAQSNKVFIENLGQWDSRIEFSQILADGNLFLESDGFTYALYEKSYIRELHDNQEAKAPEFIKSHTIKTKFVNSNPSVTLSKEDESSFYYNYFHGKDKDKWKSNVRSTSKVNYKELYSHIDLSVYTEFGSTKYDFIVQAGGKVDDIQIDYLGIDEIYLEGDRLIIVNTINNIEEAKPFSYQIIDGKRVEVPCKYVLSGKRLSFEFPSGYDESKTLIIDPVVVFSSYSGSTADNFGFTATYDQGENTYAGGIVFNSGAYPTTLGAYQTSFNTSQNYYVDVAISKFNINGTNLLFSTYLGGSRSEAPHSLSVNNNNELFVMGTTGSSNFPTTVSAYDRGFSGGPDVRPKNASMYYLHGSDIFVSKFNAAGTVLLGSTFVGGTGNDGLNTDNLLSYNYGDAFRGEITIDSSGNAIVASTTNSTNFPTTAGAPQTTYGGGFSDACVFILDSDLQNLSWSTYFGGSAQDAGYGIQFDSYNNLFVTGGTYSSNLVTTSGAYDRTHNGSEDGFVVKYNTTTSSLLASTYIGTNSYDQSYMVQVDINDDVYVTGQTRGNYPVSLGVYSNPNSTQFFHKFNNDLDTSYWSTVVGSGRNTIDISPSAFLVNDCGLIYLSGWGGETNKSYRASGSSTLGLPLSPDAFQSTTDGSDFYLLVLDRDATGLRYGTYYGGNVSQEHVDGGTSRFDKKGNVYQAVCAGCGGHNDLPTTPGAWSTTNNSNNCNLGVIKMNIAYIKSIASSPAPFICLPDSVNFVNNSSGGNSYKWYFGDGDSSSVFQPTHVYPDTGTYTVTLIVYDSTGCIPADTGLTLVSAYKPKELSIDAVPVICKGDSVQLNAYNGQSYNWTPSFSLSNDTISNPISFPIQTITYKLVSEYYCNEDSVYITVTVDTNTLTTNPDTTICEGTSVTLSATGGATYNWYPAVGLQNGTTATPTVTPLSPMYYYVDVVSAFGCTFTDSVYVDFHNDTMTISNDTSICIDQSVTLNGTGGGSYTWSTSATTNSITETPKTNTTYYLDVVSPNGCLLNDSVEITVFNDAHSITQDTGICLGESSTLTAQGGGTYVWNNSKTTNSITETPTVTTSYSVITTSPNGCLLYDTVEVFVNIDTITTNPDTTICEGTSVTLSATGGATYNWYPAVGLQNGTTANPTVTPVAPMYYYVDVVSAFGCTFTDSVYVDFHNDAMTISNDTSICVNQPVVLNATGGGSYLWSNSQTTNSITETPKTNTTYYLDVVSPNGCLLNDSVEITVFNDAHSITQDTGICLGESSTITAQGGGTYVWNNSKTTNSITETPTVTTSYSVITTSPNGCLLYDTVEVFVNIDTITTNPDTTICEGTSVMLSAQGGATYNWYPSVGLQNGTTATPTVTPVSPMYYYVDVVSAFGCTFTDSVYVDFHNDTMTISNDTSICVNQPVVLNATGGGSYLWSNSQTTNSITETPKTNTTYYLDVVSPNGCLLNDSVEITVFNDAHSITQDTGICLGESSTITAQGGGTYVWNNSKTTNSITETPTVTTSYSVITTSPNGCLLYDTVEVFVNIDTITTNPDTTICEGTSVMLSAQGGATYNWYPAVGLQNGTTPIPTVTPVSPMYYYVDVVSAFGCTFTDSVYVDFHNDTMTISNDTSICIDQSVTLNGTGGGSYTWSTSATTNSITETPKTNTTYYLDVVSPNGCLLNDSVEITVFNDAHSITQDTGICLGESSTITAQGGGTYVWNNSKTTNLITETPTVTTSYSVITTSPNGCLLYDTVEVFVNIDTITTNPDTTICEGTSVTLSATGGATYNWYPSVGLQNGTTATPTVTPVSPMYYYVDVVSAFGCTFTDSVYVDFHNDTMTISNDTSICVNQPVVLNATGGGSYLWSNSQTTNSITETPKTNTTYYLDVVSPNGCLLNNSVEITVFNDAHSITQDTGICLGESSTITAQGGGTYVWNNSKTTNSITETPTVTTSYSVITTSPNGCLLYDTVEVFVNIDTITTNPDTTICEGTSVTLSATGGATYNWYPAVGLQNGTTANPTVTPVSPMYYYVDVVSAFGCTFTDSVYVDFHNDTMTISNDTSICIDQSVTLNGTGGGSYLWNNSKTTSSITETPKTNTTYYLDVVSPNGCLLNDSVEITVFNDAHSITQDTGICLGESSTLTAQGGRTYVWNNSKTTNSITETPTVTTSYSVITTSPNGCLLYDTVEVFVNIDTITTNPDTTICEGTSVMLSAQGGATYNWYPSVGLQNGTTATPTVTPVSPMYYYVDVVSAFGCTFTDSVYVDFHNDTMTISNDTSICIDQSVTLNGTGGGSYTWSTSSTTNSITETPKTNTTYYLDVVSPNGCLLNDSVMVTLFNDSMSISPDTTICLGSNLTLFSSGGGSYSWDFDSTLSGNLSSAPLVSPTTATNYKLTVVSSNGCILKDSVTVALYDEVTGVSPATIICPNDTTLISAFGGSAYVWRSESSLSSPTNSHTRAFPKFTTQYQVRITTPRGCVVFDSVLVSVDTNRINPLVSGDTLVCASKNVVLSASGGSSYLWSPAMFVSSPTDSATLATPLRSTTFYVDISNRCYSVRDSMYVTVAGNNSIVVPDDTICPGTVTNIVVSGAVSYTWKFDNSILSGINSSNLAVQPTEPTRYKVMAVDGFGCLDSASVLIDLFDEPVIDAGSDQIIELGESAILKATSGPGIIKWMPSTSLSCETCRVTQVFPQATTTYQVQLTDNKGCKSSDEVQVQIGGVLRLPNSFTPNGDGTNDVFHAVGENITTFKMQIFNRWGELIFESNDIENGWDGTHKGVMSKVDTYVWTVTYSHLTKSTTLLRGHVNLIR